MAQMETYRRFLQRCSGGIEERNRLFNKLKDRFETPIYALALSNLGDEQDAEDATQDATIIIYEKRHQCRNPEKLLAWATSIVRNTAIGMAKKRSKYSGRNVSLVDHEEIISTSDGDRENPERVLEKKQRSVALGQEINSLPEPQRTTMNMRKEGYKQAEIAEKTGQPINTVKTQQSRAKGTLRSALHSF